MVERIIEKEKRFRVIVAPVIPQIASLPIELPNMVKILFRSGDWEPLSENLKTIEKAKQDRRFFGVLATPREKNQYAVDIEELHK